MPLHADLSAVEALPLRLLIVSVVAGLSVVPAADALQTLQNRGFLDRCSIQLESIVHTAQLISLEGIGSRRTIDVNLDSGGSLRMGSMSLGDMLGGPAMSSVILELSGGQKMIRQASEPFVWLASERHASLVVESPIFTLCLTASEIDGERLVCCEVVGWTS